MCLMATFKIHRLRESAFQQFRWAPHITGSTQVKPRDYAQAGSIEAATAYAAWTALKETGEALRVGDILEDEGGSLRICKYVGFDEAHWFVPEPKPASEPGAAPPDGNGESGSPGTESKPE
jgi:hypothetical protein